VTEWAWFSFVPGLAVPGMAQPAGDGLAELPAESWLYIGHTPVTYMDYIDTSAAHTLTAVPGQSYSMIPVARPGLTIPPPDDCWLTATNKWAPRIAWRPAAESGAVQLARARAHSAQLHARMARGERIGGG
jgi:hypothetical protein